MAGHNDIIIRISGDNAQFLQSILAALAALRQLDSGAGNLNGTLNNLNNTINNLNRRLDQMGGAARNSLSGDVFGGFLGGLAKAQLAAQAVLGVLSSIKDVAASIVMPGFEFVRDMETAKLGMAGTLASMGQINGEAIDFNTALSISSDMMQKLNGDAIRTAASTKDLVTTFQGILAPGLGAGLNLEQIREFTTTGVNAAKAMGLNSTQFVQELRDLLQGGITASSSTIASAMGLTDADIKAAKDSAEGLFTFLMKRMEGFKYSAEAYPETFSGMFSMIEEYATQASAKITEAFGPEIKMVAQEVAELFGEVNKTTGEFEVNPAILDFIVALQEVYFWVLEIIDGVVDFYTVLADIVPVEDLIGILEDLLVTIGHILRMVWNIRKAWELFLDQLMFSEPIKKVIALVRELTQAIREFFKQGADNWEAIADRAEEKIAEGTGDKLKHSNFAGEARARAADQRAKLAAEKAERDKPTPNVTSKYPKREDAKAAERAQKEAERKFFKAQEDALKRALAMIKANLSEQLKEIKKAMEEISVLFDQGMISWQEKITKDAQAEIDKEQKTVDALVAQIERIKATPVRDEDREKQAQEIEKLTAELEDHRKTLQELSENQRYAAELIAAAAGNLLPAANGGVSQAAQSGGQAAGIPQGATPEEGALYLALQELKSIDKTGQLNYETLLAIAEQESSGRHWDENGNVKVSSDGGVGLMQLTSDEAQAMAGNPYDLVRNAYGGAKFFLEILKSVKGDVREALRRYNGSGPAAEAYADEVMARIENKRARANELLSAPLVADPIVRQTSTSSASTGIGERAAAEGRKIIDEGLTYADLKCTEFVIESLKRAGLDDTLGQYGKSILDYLDPLVSGFGSDDEAEKIGIVAKTKAAGIWKDYVEGMELAAGDVLISLGSDGTLRAPGHAMMYAGNGRVLTSSGRHGPGTPIDEVALENAGQIVGVVSISDILRHVSGGSISDIISGAAGSAGGGANALPVAHNKAQLDMKRRAEQAQKQWEEETAKAFFATQNNISLIQKKQLVRESEERIRKYELEKNEEAAVQERILLQHRLLDLNIEQASRYLDVGMRTIKDNAEDMVYKIGAHMYTLADAAKRYTSYIYDQSDMANVHFVADQLDALQKQFRDASELGNTELAFKAKEKIKEVKKDLLSIIENFKSAVKDNVSWQTSMIDADSNMTTGQKGRAKAAVESWGRQQERRAEESMADRGWASYRKYYREVEERLKEAVDDAERARIKESAEIEKARILAEDILPHERAAALLERLERLPSVLEKVRSAAKQSLEDGLVTFLTDGINQAESMEDALSDLARTVLQAIQKAYAESIVADLMDKWFPAQQMPDGGASVDAADAQVQMMEANYQRLLSSTSNFIGDFFPQTQTFQTGLQTFFTSIFSVMESANSRIHSFSLSPLHNPFGLPSFSEATTQQTNVQQHAAGGYIQGPGTGTSDSILSRLSNGEFVVKAAAVKKYGRETLERINNGTFANIHVRIPKFAAGGMVGRHLDSAASRFTTELGASIPIHLTANNYVDGKRIFDTYGKPFIRSEIERDTVRNARLRSELGRRLR
nr:MAG TPA: hypothetical protein [Caudoviricetes sp.]